LYGIITSLYLYTPKRNVELLIIFLKLGKTIMSLEGTLALYFTFPIFYNTNMATMQTSEEKAMLSPLLANCMEF